MTLKDNNQSDGSIIIPEKFLKNKVNCIVLRELLKCIINNQSEPIITYGELASKISNDFNPRNLNKYLLDVSNVCKENGFPLISSIVVNKNTGLPGEGFYNYFYKDQPMKEWENIYNKCKSEIINCMSWQKLLEAMEK